MGDLVWLAIMAVMMLLVGPILGTIAFVRSGRLRRLLAEQEDQHKSAIAALRGELADLRRALAKLTDRLDQQAPIAAAPAPPAAPKPEPVAEPAKPVEPALVAPPKPVAPPAPPAQAQPQAPVQPQKPAPVAPPAKPTPPRPEPPTPVPPAAKPPVTPPPAPPRPPLIPPIGPLPTAPPSYVEPPRASARTTVANYAPLKATPPRKSLLEQLRAVLPLEEVLGMNWLSKIGIVLLVVGVALFGKYALGEMGPLGKVALLYAVSFAMLGGGIYVEHRQRYQLIGRTGIAGGWALLFFTTYAMHFVQPMAVLPSQTLSCILMLGVAVAMVAHTLRYQSQLVTGLSFLLAFATVALSQDTVYALTASAILAIGIVAIALRQGWYELEVFGILASYLNHLYWLWRIHPGGMAGHAFPEFWPSTIILTLYWLTFRISYVARGIRSARDEHTSTVAALLNTALLLAVMKFQSTRPELAFYALLALGALEFFFGQLPATRRRRSAFILLTVLGTVLMFASVPFKFTGNNIAVLWIIAAEVLIVAGIVQSEVVFRRLGLLTGLFTGLLVAYNAAHILRFRQTSEAPLSQDGILLLTAAAVFYLNAHFIRRKWSDLFNTLDGRLATTHSYIGGVTAFIGAWGVFTYDWTALAWAVLMLAAAFGARRLVNQHLLWQCWALAVAVLWRALDKNCQFSVVYPQHIVSRSITLPIIAVAFYLAAYALREVADGAGRWLHTLMTWSGTALLAILVGVDSAPHWAPVIWIGMALLLVEAARRFKSGVLLWQTHALGVLATYSCWTAYYAPASLVPMDWRGAPLFVVPIAAALYWLAYRVGLFARAEARYVRALYTWAATGLLAYLTWRQLPLTWVPLAWIAFGVALSLIGRRINLTSLCHQEHVLAALAIGGLFEYDFIAVLARDRYLTFGLVAVALYAVSRRCTVKGAGYARAAAWLHTWAATAVLAALAWHESPEMWLAPLWAVFAIALAVFDRLFDVEELPYQAHVLAILSAALTASVNIHSTELWHNLSLRLVTVSIVVVVLYALARWVRVPEDLRQRDIHHVYSWVGSFLAAWLLWSELQPVGVAVGIAVFGLVLFEWGSVLKQTQLRRQAYVALTAAFARVFFVNLTAAPVAGEQIGPRLFTVVPIAMIYFFVWWQLQSEKSETGVGNMRIADLIAYFGTACITALLYFQTNPEWIVATWAVAVMALMAASLWLKRAVFLHQATLLTFAIVARGIAHNLYGGSYFTGSGWRGNFAVLTTASAILLATLPIAFRLRSRYAAAPKQSKLGRFVAVAVERPDQLQFFAPVLLITLMIAVKMNPGMVTLSWGLEGVLVFLLALAVGQRSYRLTGLALLLLCVGKIVMKDAWRLAERDRYITFIVLGAALVLVSFLYSKYRESVRQYL